MYSMFPSGRYQPGRQSDRGEPPATGLKGSGMNLSLVSSGGSGSRERRQRRRCRAHRYPDGDRVLPVVEQVDLSVRMGRPMGGLPLAPGSIDATVAKVVVPTDRTRFTNRRFPFCCLMASRSGTGNGSPPTNYTSAHEEGNSPSLRSSSSADGTVPMSATSFAAGNVGKLQHVVR